MGYLYIFVTFLASRICLYIALPDSQEVWNLPTQNTLNGGNEVSTTAA